MKTPIKYLLSALTIALIGSCGAVFGQEVELTNQTAQQGLDVHVGDTDLAIQVHQFNVRDGSGNLVTSVPFLSGASFLPSDTQITDTLYALTPPDGNNNVTAIVMYQADPSQSIESDTILQAVQDSINHNYTWAGAQFTVRAVIPGETLPAGTQFWACSASGTVACSGSGILSVAATTVPAQPE
jgi:hypothetical protein